MAGLVISLRPYEKVLVSGVVLQNGKRRAELRVCDERAGVLRLSEALHPDQATTPLTRTYFAAQTIIAGDADEEIAAPVLLRLLREAAEGYAGFSFAGTLDEAEEAAKQASYYRVMKLLRPLLPQEAAVLADPAFSLPKGAAETLRLARPAALVRAEARARVEAAGAMLAGLR